jgi:2-methylisoborneol synthase
MTGAMTPSALERLLAGPGGLGTQAARLSRSSPDRDGAEAVADYAGLIGELLSSAERPDASRLPSLSDLPARDASEPSAAADAAQLLVAPPPGTKLPPPPLPLTAAGAEPMSRPSGLGSRSAHDGDEPADDEPLPELFCPGAVRDDPALGEIVNEGLVAWAEEVGIYEGALDRLRDCNFGHLIMLAHPATDDPDRLLAATKCVVAEWAADDYLVDEVSLGADPNVVGSRLAILYAVVDPAPLPTAYALELDDYRECDPIARAFRSAMRHLARYTSVTQMARFQHQMTILFTAWNQEADWHRNGRTPPVWEYLVQRHLNSYLPPMILIDPLAGYELPPIEYYDPRVRRVFTMAGAANVLLNDLYSAGFESDTDFNLPRVIVAEEGCSWRQAIRRTVEIHNELMYSFVAEATALSLAGSPWLRRFFADTWAWMGGSREWHATTGRYQSQT